MELRFLNPAVLRTVQLKESDQLSGCQLVFILQSAEVLYLQQGGFALIDLVFVIAYGMEVCASG